MASNTACFSFAVNGDGVQTLDEEETSLFTLAVLADMAGDEAPKECHPIQDEKTIGCIGQDNSSKCEGSRLPRERC